MVSRGSFWCLNTSQFILRLYFEILNLWEFRIIDFSSHFERTYLNFLDEMRSFQRMLNVKIVPQQLTNNTNLSISISKFIKSKKFFDCFKKVQTRFFSCSILVLFFSLWIFNFEQVQIFIFEFFFLNRKKKEKKSSHPQKMVRVHHIKWTSFDLFLLMVFSLYWFNALMNRIFSNKHEK